MTRSKLLFGIALMILACVVLFIGWDVQKRRSAQKKMQKHLQSATTQSINGVISVSSQCVGDITFYPSDRNEVVYSYDPENFINESRIEGQELIIDFSHDDFGFVQIIDNDKPEVKIYSTQIEQIIQQGVGHISSEGTLRSEKMKLMNDGTGSMHIALNCLQLDVTNSGVGSIHMEGNADNAKIINEGTGSIKAGKLMTKILKAENAGVGSMDIYASDTLSMINDGVGSIHYSGNAFIKTKVEEGVGSIQKD
ncbi:MAG TPA: hypothetical protein DCF44_06215 [Chitinophagaceae bacterium]|nr:hypothetical protein [Chitinophagaceae bacterium]